MPDFDKYAATGAYHWRECDPTHPDFNPPLVARYRAVLDLVHGGRVLDVGGGDGYLASRLAQQCDLVAAVEYDDTGAGLARSMLSGLPNTAVIQGDCYALPLADACLDTVVLADVIEHLERPEVALAEIRRLLRPGGCLVLTTPQWRADRVWDSRHVQEFKPYELQGLLAGAFTTVELSYLWPRRWMDLYRTRVGWRLLKITGRMGWNPFNRRSATPRGFCQMLAVCSGSHP